jgi:hypothetical protein
MTLEQRLDQLAQLQYPNKVDVVDSVMAKVSQRPYLRPVRRTIGWRQAAIAAAAAVATLLVVNITVFRPATSSNEDMGFAIAQFNDYSSWNTVEEAAVNPFEYLYEE